MLELKKVLMRWKHEFITKAEYKKLISLNLILPLAYGCLKIYKIGNLLRIIISLIGNPLHNLASYLHKIFNDSLPQTINFIGNRFKLVESIFQINISNDEIILSLDVISLFTNIPVDLVIVSVKNRWNLIQDNTNISLNEFIIALKLVLNSMFFIYVQ